MIFLGKKESITEDYELLYVDSESITPGTSILFDLYTPSKKTHTFISIIFICFVIL